ncbi:hypothetical protein [Oceanithermus desulfurans]
MNIRRWLAVTTLAAGLVAAQAPGYVLALDFPSTSLNFEMAARKHVGYLVGDPFYLEVGLGYRYYFLQEAYAPQRLAGFFRAEGLYSFSQRSFQHSYLGVGMEVSPDGRIVVGAELTLRPLAWVDLPSNPGFWDYLGLLEPRAVAEYLIPLPLRR